MAEKLIESFITVNAGARGFYAVHVGRFEKENMTTYLDVIQTGIGSYEKESDAQIEAKEWANSVGVEYNGE